MGRYGDNNHSQVSRLCKSRSSKGPDEMNQEVPSPLDLNLGQRPYDYGKLSF